MTKPSYQITNIPFTSVSISDDFWTPRMETNRAVTVPYDFQKCEETGRIRNFDVAAGVARDHPPPPSRSECWRG